MAWTNVVKLSERLVTDEVTRQATAFRRFYVENDAVITADEALSASFGGVAVPGASDAFSVGRPWCRPRSRTVEWLSPYQRHVDVDYADPTDGVTVDPTTQAALISTADGRSVEEYFIDRADPPVFVRNAAGEPFDRGPERIADSLIFTIRKFVNALTYSAVLNALHTMNASPKTIKGYTFDTHTLLLASADFQDLEGPVSGVQEAQIHIEYRPGGWIDRTPNVGYSQLLPGGERRDIVQQDNDGSFVRVSKPHPLNADGTKTASTVDEPDILDFYPYHANAWTGVPLA